MVTFSTVPWFTRSRKVVYGMVSFVPLVVWKRLQRRSTRTMMTTQRRTVLPVEFKDVPPRMAWNAAAVPLDTALTDGGYENSRGRLDRWKRWDRWDSWDSWEP